MSDYISKRMLLEDLRAWKGTYEENGYSQHSFAINGVIDRVEKGQFDAPEMEREQANGARSNPAEDTEPVEPKKMEYMDESMLRVICNRYDPKTLIAALKQFNKGEEG